MPELDPGIGDTILLAALREADRVLIGIDLVARLAMMHRKQLASIVVADAQIMRAQRINRPPRTSSSRVHITLTGFLTAFESATAS